MAKADKLRYIIDMAGIKRTGLVIFALLMFSVLPMMWGDNQDQHNQLIEKMIDIVLENNPTLKSQERIVLESREFSAPRSSFALTGLSFNLGSTIWNSDTNSFSFVPVASLGAGFSPGDPARILNIFKLKKEKEGAKQYYQQLKNSTLSDLFSNVRNILNLKSRNKSLEDLKVYLEDYSNLTEKQVKAGVVEPEPDKLWDLKERIMGIEVEIQDVKNKLSTIKLEAALRLAGEDWKELLELFEQLD